MARRLYLEETHTILKETLKKEHLNGIRYKEYLTHRRKTKMNNYLEKIIPFVRVGPIRIHTTMGHIEVAEISNVVIYNKAGDFFLRLGKTLETSQVHYEPFTELPCWELVSFEGPCVEALETTDTRNDTCSYCGFKKGSSTCQARHP